MRVCVVGAGFAGLAAALELDEAGADVSVIEARDRVGGRVWSEVLENGSVVERGAEFVLHGYDVMRSLAKKLGVRLIPTGMAYGRREPWDSSTDVDGMLAAFTELKTLADRQPDLRTVGDVIEESGIDTEAAAAVIARLSISCAHEAEELAASILGHSGSAISNEPSHRIAGGNDQLAKAIATKLGDRIRIRTAVTRVEWGPKSVSVQADGFEETFDAALLTVPASVIGKVHFDPSLPAEVSRAVDEIVYGHAAKLFLPLKDEPQPSAVMSVTDHYWCWTALGDGEKPQPVLSCFAGSRRSLDALEVTDGPGKWARSVAGLRPDLDLDVSKAMVSTWDDDPWVGAAYTAEVAGHPRTDVMTRPVGALHLAGEHTAGEWAGTMEGALRSGVRGARAILEG